MAMSKVRATAKLEELVQAQTLTDVVQTSPEREPLSDKHGLKETDAAVHKTLQENPDIARILKNRGKR